MASEESENSEFCFRVLYPGANFHDLVAKCSSEFGRNGHQSPPAFHGHEDADVAADGEVRVDVRLRERNDAGFHALLVPSHQTTKIGWASRFRW